MFVYLLNLFKIIFALANLLVCFYLLVAIFDCNPAQLCCSKGAAIFHRSPQPACEAGWQGVGSFAGEAGWVAIFDCLDIA
jgi:hypothetical protein